VTHEACRIRAGSGRCEPPRTMCCRLIQVTDLNEHLRTALMVPMDPKTGERLDRTVAVHHCTVPSREDRSRMLVQAESIRPAATRAANAVGGSLAATKAGISHSFLTDWPDGTGLRRLRRTPGRMLTCRYGFRRTDRTPSVALRIRRLRVRVPPSAPSSQARWPPGSGLSCRSGSHAGSHAHMSAAEQGPAHRPGRRAPSHSGETRRSIRLISAYRPGSVLLAAPSRSVPAHSDQTPGQYTPHGCPPGGRPFAVAPSTTWADDRRRCKAPHQTAARL
jgi:hypothetical protein